MAPTEHVELSEYATSEPLRLTAWDLRLLHSLPADRLTTLATRDPGLVRLRATSWVGTIPLATITVRITPKVDDLRNVLMMMTSGAGLTDWSTTDVGYERADLVEGVAELVLRVIDGATRRGLVHGYQEIEDRLLTLRGRLLVSEVARRPWEPLPVPCRFEEFTDDITENRILKTCVLEIGRWSLGPVVRRLVRTLTARFENVAVSSSPTAELTRVRTTPVNQHYAPALQLCRLVFEGASPLHRAGDVLANAFMVDMNTLFERWISAELKRRLWPELRVMEQESTPLSRRPTVGMWPDLVFRRGKQDVYVADVKYKLTGSGLARSADYYQLLAYTTVLGLRAGALIYCQYDEAPPREVIVERGGQTLRCLPLPLGGAWSDVDSALQNLAAAIDRHACW